MTLCPDAKEDIRAPDGDFPNKPSGGRFATRFTNLDSPAEAQEKLLEKARASARGDSAVGCTCGVGCKAGEGCQRSCFDKSETRAVTASIPHP